MKIGKYDATEIEVGDERYDPLVYMVSLILCEYTLNHPGYFMISEWTRQGLPRVIICSTDYKDDLVELDRRFAHDSFNAAIAVNRDQTWDGTEWRVIRDNEPNYDRALFYGKGRMFYWEKPL